jgi:hypothetical protein
MQIYPRVIDDFKTERKDITSPLPAYLRLVPLVLYLTVAAAILLNALFLVLSGQASKVKEDAVKEDRRIAAELEAAKAQRQSLESETKKATDLISWVEASRPLQTLLVEIARSIGEGASLNELNLERSDENPAQILLTLRLRSENPRQLDETLQTISRSQFKMFSPQQSFERGEVEYKATLLWQNPSIIPASSVQ